MDQALQQPAGNDHDEELSKAAAEEAEIPAPIEELEPAAIESEISKHVNVPDAPDLDMPEAPAKHQLLILQAKRGRLKRWPLLPLPQNYQHQ